MSNIATTIEKSKRLLELGLDPKTADMYYTPLNMDYPWVWKGKPLLEKDAVPAWSLSALLEVMRKANAVTTLQVTSLSTLLRCKDMGFIWQNDLYINDPTTAAYEMVCYLLRNNLIEKGGQDESDN